MEKTRRQKSYFGPFLPFFISSKTSTIQWSHEYIVMLKWPAERLLDERNLLGQDLSVSFIHCADHLSNCEPGLITPVLSMSIATTLRCPFSLDCPLFHYYHHWPQTNSTPSSLSVQPDQYKNSSYNEGNLRHKRRFLVGPSRWKEWNICSQRQQPLSPWWGSWPNVSSSRTAAVTSCF